VTAKSGFVLAAIFVLACVGVIRLPASDTWGSFCLNLATEVVGIFLTVLLIDRALRRQEREQQRKMARIAYQRLRRPLGDAVSFWFAVLKGCLPAKPAQIPCEFREILEPENLQALMSFDAATKAPVHPEQLWCTYMAARVESLRQALDSIVDKYAFVLSPEEVARFEDCSGSDFTARMAPILPLVGRQHGTPFACCVDGRTKEEISPLLVTHLQAIAELVENFNKLAPPGEALRFPSDQHWADTIAPRIGSARFLVAAPRA